MIDREPTFKEIIKYGWKDGLIGISKIIVIVLGVFLFIIIFLYLYSEIVVKNSYFIPYVIALLIVFSLFYEFAKQKAEIEIRMDYNKPKGEKE